MAKEVEFCFDIVSPASYLAWTQIGKLAEETGARIVYRPFFLPGLFKEAGSSSPITIPAKSKWLFQDVRRFAKRYNIKFWMNEHFPLNTLYIMRGLIAFADRPQMEALCEGFFKAMWANNENLADPEIIGRIVAEAGVDPREWLAAINDETVKQRVFDINTELAGRGAFGAPTFFVERNGKSEMHWGQDRIDFVREALLDG